MKDLSGFSCTGSPDFSPNQKNKYRINTVALHSGSPPPPLVQSNTGKDEPVVMIVCRFGEEVRIPRRALREEMLTEYARRLGETEWKSDGMALRSGQLFYAVQSVATMIRGQTVELTEDNVGDIYAAARELQVEHLLGHLEDYLVDHVDKLATSHLEKLDAALFERVLLKRIRSASSTSIGTASSRTKGFGNDAWRWARVLFRWWRVDLGKRKEDFTRLAEHLSYNAEACSSSESCSSEQDLHTLSRIEIPRKGSSSIAGRPISGTPQRSRIVTVAGCLWNAELEGEMCVSLKVCDCPPLQNSATKCSTVTVPLVTASAFNPKKPVTACITLQGHLKIIRGDNRPIEMGEKIMAILTYRGTNIFWMEDNTFQMTGLSEVLEPCPMSLLENLRLIDLPLPPHKDWLGRICTGGGGCVLLYYPCWGLFLRRPNESSWKLLSEDLFVEYLSPIPSTLNAFYVLAWKGYSLQAYKTGDLSLTCYTFIREMDARIGGTFYRRYRVVTELSWAENVVLYIRHPSEDHVHFERHNILKNDTLIAVVSTKYSNKIKEKANI